jgi:hypothetical protein
MAGQVKAAAMGVDALDVLADRPSPRERPKSSRPREPVWLTMLPLR